MGRWAAANAACSEAGSNLTNYASGVEKKAGKKNTRRRHAA